MKLKEHNLKMDYKEDQTNDICQAQVQSQHNEIQLSPILYAHI